MTKRNFAIANCRVSSDEQLSNNSLARQQMSVESAAERLDAEIKRIWSGSVSSKAGTNINRQDLLEMLEYCKKNKNIKYAIFDEYDRFMRSVNEGPYFEVLFEKTGVKVWYASETDTFNGDDAMAKFMRAMSAYKAEGSNEERQRKSISGHVTALKQGRYPYPIKPGYIKGIEPGVQEVHPTRGPVLQATLIDLIQSRNPTQALINLNNSSFTTDHSPLKMDKFRVIATDPFYAGIVEMHKQVEYRNEDGAHEPLISKDQHYQLIEIFNDKKKLQKGPRKNGNPDFPCNNILNCDLCTESGNGRAVGFKHTNGKPGSNRMYFRYKCRSCGRLTTRAALHDEVIRNFNEHPISQDGLEDLLDALKYVWKQQETQAIQDANRINRKISELGKDITQHVEAATDPDNSSIKDDILELIAKKKSELNDLEKSLREIEDGASDDREDFLRFAFDFVEKMGIRFLEIDEASRKRCKQIIFPAGLYWNSENKVYTPEVSPLIRLAAKKKDTEVSENSLMVRVQGL